MASRNGYVDGNVLKFYGFSKVQTLYDYRLDGFSKVQTLYDYRLDGFWVVGWRNGIRYKMFCSNLSSINITKEIMEMEIYLNKLWC